MKTLTFLLNSKNTKYLLVLRASSIERRAVRRARRRRGGLTSARPVPGMDVLPSSLGAVLYDRPHLRTRVPQILSESAALFRGDPRDAHEALKRAGVARLGHRQEVLVAIESAKQTAAGGVDPTRASHDALSSEQPVAVGASCSFDGVLCDSVADRGNLHVALALALAEHGFVVCKGGVPDLAAAVARDADALAAGKQMRAGASVESDDYAIPDQYSASVPVSCFLRRESPDVGPSCGASAGRTRTRGTAAMTADLANLDGRLRRLGGGVVDALAKLCAVDACPLAFPFAMADDGGKLCCSEVAELMVSCFPADGASYAPHVDNTDGDGRGADLGRCFVRHRHNPHSAPIHPFRIPTHRVPHPIHPLARLVAAGRRRCSITSTRRGTPHATEAPYASTSPAPSRARSWTRPAVARVCP